MQMRPLLISASDARGGAARASNRLHEALVDSGIESRLLVQEKLSDSHLVVGPESKLQKLMALLRPTIDQLPTYLRSPRQPILHSPSFLPFSRINQKSISSLKPDIVHLHWVCGGALTIREIGKISQPIVWTMHDMWAFSGAEHCTNDASDARFRRGYSRMNRVDNESGFDVDRWVWKRKKKHWKQQMFFVSPSNWLADCARDSALLKGQNIRVIPNALNTNVWKPIEKKVARQILGLPQDSKLVLFGALGGESQHIKGADLLKKAMHSLVRSSSNLNCQLVIFGQSQPQHHDYPLPAHYMGHKHDDTSLILLYSAADVMLVPSRIDNLPQTAVEAHACGCPVVAFNTCGLSDVVDDGVTGLLAPAFDTEKYSSAVLKVLSSEKGQKTMPKEARKRAVSLWSYDVVVPQYLKLYEEAIASARSN